MKLVNIATKFLAFCMLVCLTGIDSLRAATQVGTGGPNMPMGPMQAGPMPGGMPGTMQLPGAPMDMPRAGQQAPLPPQGSMPSPTAEEIEDAFAKVEEIQKNDPEMFKRLEDAGKDIIKELAKQDPKQLEAFAQSFGLSPEELLAEAEKPSSAEPEAYVPATGEEPEEEPEEEPRPIKTPTTPKVIEPISSKKPVPVDEGRVRRAIAQVAEHIESLRTKMASSPNVYEELRSLELDLLSLALLIAIVDAPAHFTRLATGEYSDLVSAIEKLAAALIAQEQLIQAFRPSQTKYDLLGVSPQVTAKQLDKVFKELKKRLDPKVIEKKLKKQGLAGDDLKRQIKAARITFSEIEEAYDLIKDPVTRRDIVDRAIELEAKQQGIDLTTSKAAIADIREALSDALYRDEIISKLEEYLEKYAPEELKQKKAREKEEKKRLEEQKRRARQSPVLTPGEYFEPNISMPSAPYSGYGTGSTTPTWSPEASRYQPQYPDYASTGDGKDRDRERDKGTEKDKPKGDGASTKELSQAEKEKNKIDTRPVKDIISSLDKKFKEFSKAYDEPANEKLRKSIFGQDQNEIKKLETELADQNKKMDELTKIEFEKEEKKGEAKPAETEGGEKKPETATTGETTKTEEPKKEVKKSALTPEQEKLTKKMSGAEAELGQKIQTFNIGIDKLRTELKIDPVYEEFDKLSRVVNVLRAQGPKDPEWQAWNKFTEWYERGEPLPAPAQSADKPAVTKAPKAKPSANKKIDTLITGLQNITGASEEEGVASRSILAESEVLADFASKLMEIKKLERRVDRHFKSRVPTVEQKAVETPKETSKTEPEKK